jgi:hypothetical protein
MEAIEAIMTLRSVQWFLQTASFPIRHWKKS